MYNTKNAPVKRDWLVAALNRGQAPKPVSVDIPEWGHAPQEYYHTPSPFAFRVNETRDK